ncbi:uncharacterized protein G2W53_033452 [Senna tora]|uniref:Uncharacterized protein n=1 Tax=Senna tora TaxID=362788 RepID=A0A834T1B4_9FABA|nr:uncharacterized protein G2W53_033452 [Senna tora]
MGLIRLTKILEMILHEAVYKLIGRKLQISAGFRTLGIKHIIVLFHSWGIVEERKLEGAILPLESLGEPSYGLNGPSSMDLGLGFSVIRKHLPQNIKSRDLTFDDGIQKQWVAVNLSPNNGSVRDSA